MEKKYDIYTSAPFPTLYTGISPLKSQKTRVKLRFDDKKDRLVFGLFLSYLAMFVLLKRQSSDIKFAFIH